MRTYLAFFFFFARGIVRERERERSRAATCLYPFGCTWVGLFLSCAQQRPRTTPGRGKCFAEPPGSCGLGFSPLHFVSRALSMRAYNCVKGFALDALNEQPCACNSSFSLLIGCCIRGCCSVLAHTSSSLRETKKEIASLQALRALTYRSPYSELGGHPNLQIVRSTASHSAPPRHVYSWLPCPRFYPLNSSPGRTGIDSDGAPLLYRTRRS